MMLKALFGLIGAGIVVLLVLFIGAAVFWGLGSLAVFVFNISYSWTIWHGLVCELFYILLKDMLTPKK